MNITSCFPQTISKLFLAILLAIFALGFVVSGFTVLPIIGFVAAIPFIGISIYLFKAHLNKQCEIEPA
ncbi:MAG: hypothetical protein ACOZF0_15670 [Thermodesulfobacteriota bacterium]